MRTSTLPLLASAICMSSLFASDVTVRDMHDQKKFTTVRSFSILYDGESSPMSTGLRVARIERPRSGHPITEFPEVIEWSRIRRILNGGLVTIKTYEGHPFEQYIECFVWFKGSRLNVHSDGQPYACKPGVGIGQTTEGTFKKSLGTDVKEIILR